MVVKETDIEILGRLLALDGRRVSPENARLVLAVKFSAKDRAKIEELGEKSNEGTLTADEKELYSAYVRVMDLLAVLQSRARSALTKLGAVTRPGPAAPPSSSDSLSHQRSVKAARHEITD